MIARKARMPRMREAYPQLDIVKAMSALSRGESLCLFYEGSIHPAHGLIEFSVVPDFSEARLDGEIAVRNMRPWIGPTAILLVPNANGVQRDRRAMLCPECERRCQVLTWVGSWRCRACDGLLDRRQLVSRDTLKAEELATLKRLLSGGRRKGQHQAKFDRLWDRAERLAHELQGRRPRTPAPQHRLILRSEWMSIAEYHQRPSLQSLPVPSEERQRRPDGRFDELEGKRGSPAPPDVAPPAPTVAKVAWMSFDPNADPRGKGDDPDEVSNDDM